MVTRNSSALISATGSEKAGTETLETVQPIEGRCAGGEYRATGRAKEPWRVEWKGEQV